MLFYTKSATGLRRHLHGFTLASLEEHRQFLVCGFQARDLVLVLFDCRIDFQGFCHGIAVCGDQGVLQALGQLVDLGGDRSQGFDQGEVLVEFFAVEDAGQDVGVRLRGGVGLLDERGVAVAGLEQALGLFGIQSDEEVQLALDVRQFLEDVCLAVFAEGRRDHVLSRHRVRSMFGFGGPRAK